MVYGSEEVFQIRIDDPLVSGLHFTPNLGQGIGGLATLAIPKAARIKDLLKDWLQAIDQRLLTQKQNTRRDLVASVHKIYAAGMFVTAGFILGFDSEKSSVSNPVVDIEDSAIPMCMVSLLYALPNTQLTRRLANEGRLHQDHDVAATTGGDQCTRV